MLSNFPAGSPAALLEFLPNSPSDPVDAEVVAEYFGAMVGTVPPNAGCAMMWVFGAGTGSMRIEIS